MTGRFPVLYAITDEAAAQSHVEQVARFAAAGARLIQLRDKRMGGRQFYDVARAAIAIAHAAGACLIVNDRADVAHAAGADGVHVGQDDLDAASVRRLLGPEAIVGVSTHSIEQARAAAEQPVDYVAFGPVYPTISKQNPDPTVGLEGLARAREVVAGPLVAIGGITLDRAPEVIAAGADSVAVIGDLRAGGSVEARVRAFLRALGQR